MLCCCEKVSLILYSCEYLTNHSTSPQTIDKKFLSVIILKCQVTFNLIFSFQGTVHLLWPDVGGVGELV